jgi:hypothetical protein
MHDLLLHLQVGGEKEHILFAQDFSEGDKDFAGLKEDCL